MAEIGATFVAELKAALASEFPIAAVEFERTIEFPQLLISYAGLNPEAALRGERVPQCQIRAAVGYVNEPNDDVHEIVEDTSIRLFDACQQIPSVLVFDYNGMTRFEPLDGTEAEYFGLLFVVERSGGVRRG